MENQGKYDYFFQYLLSLATSQSPIRSQKSNLTVREFFTSIFCSLGNPVDPELHVTDDPRQENVGFFLKHHKPPFNFVTHQKVGEKAQR
jgi:hypothetical protein